MTASSSSSEEEAFLTVHLVDLHPDVTTEELLDSVKSLGSVTRIDLLPESLAKPDRTVTDDER